MKGDHETSITTRVHSRLVLPQVKAEHGTSRHELHSEYRVPFSPPQKCNVTAAGARDAGIVAIYLNLMWGGWVEKEELKLNFYNNNSQNNIRNNGTSRPKLGGENFDCVLTTTQLEIMSSLK